MVSNNTLRDYVLQGDPVLAGDGQGRDRLSDEALESINVSANGVYFTSAVYIPTRTLGGCIARGRFEQTAPNSVAEEPPGLGC